MLRLFALIGVLLLVVPRLAQADPNAAGPPAGAATAAPAASAPPEAPAAPGSSPSKTPSSPPTIVRLPAPAGSSAWVQTLTAIEAALHQLHAQLQGVKERLAAGEATLRALEAREPREPDGEAVLEALAALGSRLEALERAVGELHAQAADPEPREAIAQVLSALDAHGERLADALQALEAAAEQRHRRLETRQIERATLERRAPRQDTPPRERQADQSVSAKDPFQSAPGIDMAGPSGPAEEVALYTVRPGDTLWDLAVRFAVAPRRLIDLNGLDAPDRLRPGQRLLIPAGAQPALGP